MKKSKQGLTIHISIMALVIAFMLLCCESPKKAKREKSDEAGIPDAWNNSINENASELAIRSRIIYGNHVHRKS